MEQQKVDRLEIHSGDIGRMRFSFVAPHAARISRLYHVVWLSLLPGMAFGQTPTDDGLKFFEEKIRPVLVEHCYSCHSVAAQTSKKLQGRLFLDSADGVLDGGESGTAIVKGKSAESLLSKALKYDGLEMPPNGKLPEEIIADFAKWIDMGAFDPLSIEILAPLLDDERELPKFSILMRVCDRAAQAISHSVKDIPFNSDWDRMRKDEQIQRLKEFCETKGK
jgi:hypothetical protein